MQNRKSIGRNDRVIVFYAGHGTLQKIKNFSNKEFREGYILPFDATQGDLASYLEMESLIKACQECPAKHVLLILDCCYSGYAATRDLGIGIMSDEEPDHYLKGITGDRALQVLAAGTDEELVGDSGLRPRNSPFTGALLDILEFKPYLENEGILTAGEIAKKVRQRVSRHYKGAQNPVFNTMSGHRFGDFVFKIYDKPGSRSDDFATEQKSQIEELYRTALRQSYTEDYHSALDTIDKVLQINRSHPDAWFLKATLIFKTSDDYEQALRCYNAILELNPNDEGAKRMKAKVLKLIDSSKPHSVRNVEKPEFGALISFQPPKIRKFEEDTILSAIMLIEYL